MFGCIVEETALVAHLKVILRPFLYRTAAILLNAVSYHKKPVYVFTLSPQAREQYIKAGFDKNTLIPFGYFVPAMKVQNEKYKKMTPLRLVFVAALLKRKGLDIAIRAIQNLNRDGIKVTLDVYGSGDPTAFIPNDATNIIYKGIIPTEQSQLVIAQYNGLILPSRHDGWGVVVNEALLQGIPVIVSDRVGAKCLVETTGAGVVFENENVESLTKCLNQIIESPSLLEKMHVNAEYVKNHIVPEVAAKYFIDALLYYFFNLGCPFGVVHPKFESLSKPFMKSSLSI